MDNGNQAMESSYGGSLRYFNALFLFSQFWGLLAVIITGAWIGKFGGGLAWQSDPGRQFNYHPLFMVIGFVFLNMQAVLVYRAFQDMKKPTLKLLHGGIHLAALIIAAVGLKAVFDSHNLKVPPRPNMYSIHSWIGIITAIMFGLQFLIGAVSFLIPAVPKRIRKLYLPFHTYFGAAMFIMAIAACLTGINEIAIFAIIPPGYSAKPPEGILLNFLGLILAILGTLIPYLLIKESYRRKPLPEEQNRGPEVCL